MSWYVDPVKFKIQCLCSGQLNTSVDLCCEVACQQYQKLRLTIYGCLALDLGTAVCFPSVSLHAEVPAAAYAICHCAVLAE